MEGLVRQQAPLHPSASLVQAEKLRDLGEGKAELRGRASRAGKLSPVRSADGLALARR